MYVWIQHDIVADPGGHSDVPGSCLQWLPHVPGEVDYYCPLGPTSDIWCPGEKHKTEIIPEYHYIFLQPNKTLSSSPDSNNPAVTSS